MFINSLVKCNGGCNTRSEISGRICVPNKAEHAKLSIFNLIRTKSESILKIHYKNEK